MREQELTGWLYLVTTFTNYPEYLLSSFHISNVVLKRYVLIPIIYLPKMHFALFSQ